MKPARKLSQLMLGVLGLLLLGYLIVCGFLYVSQASFIYFPTLRIADVPSFVLPRDDAQIVVSTQRQQRPEAVIYFGGNAEDVSQNIAPLSAIFPAADIYAMHYRSYGGSTGKPSETVLVADGLALLEQVQQTHPHVTVIGRSLGSGIATQVAASKPVDRVVLVTPYYSIAELAAAQLSVIPTDLILRDTYESWRYADQISAPVSIVIAEYDALIPKASSLKLAKLFPAQSTQIVILPGADHNNISEHSGYANALRGAGQIGR